jgi:hypothetical protein
MLPSSYQEQEKRWTCGSVKIWAQVVPRQPLRAGRSRALNSGSVAQVREPEHKRSFCQLYAYPECVLLNFKRGLLRQERKWHMLTHTHTNRLIKGTENEILQLPHACTQHGKGIMFLFCVPMKTHMCISHTHTYTYVYSGVHRQVLTGLGDRLASLVSLGLGHWFLDGSFDCTRMQLQLPRSTIQASGMATACEH